MKQGLWVLGALLAGVLAGAAARDEGAWRAAAEAAAVLGSVWLDALRMTLVPLIFAVLVAAILAMAQTAAAGRLARRALGLFAAAICFSAIYAILAAHGLLALAPVDPGAAAALLAGAAPEPAAAEGPTLATWARSLIPTNVVAAAAQDAVLPIVVFACLFGFAAARLPTARQAPLAGFFSATAETMITIVGWVLALAPVGVFGLAVSLGLAAGLESLGALGHYVLMVSAVTIGITLIAAAAGLALSGLAPGRFLRALGPVQVIAASSQSSLASLPAMLAAAMGPLRIPAPVAEFALPLAVAVFRLTSPAANLAVVVFIVHISGLSPAPWQWAAAAAVAFAVSVSSVGLPGQTSFYASVAPICAAVGAPVGLLPILLAVEVIPDVFRTVGNVTGDLAAAAVLNRAEAREVSSASAGPAETGAPPG